MEIRESIRLDDVDCTPLYAGASGYCTGRAWSIIEDTNRLIIRYKKKNNLIYIIPILIIAFILFVLPPLGQSHELWKLCQILILGAAVFGTIIWFIIDKQLAHKGDWLIFDKDQQVIELPRNNVKMRKELLKCLQIIIGDPRLNLSDASLDTQVNIVFFEDDKYVRYPLMRVLASKMVWGTAIALSRKLQCPCQKIEYTILGECMKSQIQLDNECV